MKKGISLLLLFLSLAANSQSIVGNWKSIDENSNKEMAIIEIYEQNNTFFAKLKEILHVNKSHANCPDCSVKIKNKSLLGKIIILDLKKSDDEYNSGTFIDPFSDKKYSCNIKPVGNNKLKVRVFTGFYLFGKTQTWIRF